MFAKIESIESRILRSASCQDTAIAPPESGDTVLAVSEELLERVNPGLNHCFDPAPTAGSEDESHTEISDETAAESDQGESDDSASEILQMSHETYADFGQTVIDEIG